MSIDLSVAVYACMASAAVSFVAGVVCAKHPI